MNTTLNNSEGSLDHQPQQPLPARRQFVRRLLRRGALLGTALLATPLLLTPAVALGTPPAPRVAEGSTGPCQVTDGTMTWGVKESFRSYISGSIANGSWEATDGATYTTPNFQWGGATGSFDPDAGTGSVSFKGTAHFTGHDGVLDLTLTNPTIEFEGDGKASLLLDARSTDASGELVIDAKQEWVGELSAPFPLAAQGQPLKFEPMKAVLTNSGAKAFGGFYEPGAELDPVALEINFTGCDVSKSAPTTKPTTAPKATAKQATPAPATQTKAEVPWIPIGIAGVALLVIGVTAGMLISGRKRPSSETSPDPDTTENS